MNLVGIVEALGDKNYRLGRPVYFGFDDEEQQSIEVHAQPVFVVGKPAAIERIIRDRDPHPEGIAVTYGGFLGIDIAAAQNAKGVLLFDINPEQKHFWRSVIDLIKECPTAAEFRARFTQMSNRYTIRRSSEKPEAPYPSFVDDETVYEKVRSWAKAGMMAATDMDALDTQRHHELAAQLTQAEMNVSIIYLANVPYFYNISESNGRPNLKVDFYNRPVTKEDYPRIFENQKIIAGGHVNVVYSDFCKNEMDFPLLQKPLATFNSTARQAG